MTAQAVRHVHERRRTRLPTAVLAAFVSSRLIVWAVALAVSAFKGGAMSFAPLLRWDYVWYSEIAAHGFGVVRADGQTGWPFFPLLPAVLWLGRVLGLPTGLVGLVVAHAAFFAAIWGVHEITRRRFGTDAARLAAWGFALWPATVPFSMVYPDPIVCAAAVWAFVLVERRGPDQRRADFAAGVLAAVAALARPNGLIVAVALVVAVRSARRAVLVAGPAVAAFAMWLAVQWVATGEPLRFLHAKADWEEVSFVEAVLTASMPFQWQECLVVLAGLAVVLVVARRLPASWLVFYGLSVLPSLWLGMTGLGRYAASCFVPAVCVGVVLARLRPPWRVTWLFASAAALVWFAWLVFSGDGWIP